MSVIIAGLDASPVAQAVLETALKLGGLTGSDIEVVHVQEGAVETPRTLAARADVPFHLMDGLAGPTLLAAVADAGAQALVIGARSTPGGRQPVGRTAQYVLEHARAPVVVVPPEAGAPHGLRRLLLPLGGDDASASPVLEHLRSNAFPDTELIALHVFTADTVPAMLDKREYDLDIVGKEFLTRFLPEASQVELRSGPVGRRILEASQELAIDLLVLSWKQDMSPGRGRVVREVVASSLVPVLLIPVPV